MPKAVRDQLKDSHEFPRGREILFGTEGEGVEPSFFVVVVVVVQLKWS